MQIYHYSYEGEYIGESTAELDPLEGNPLIPGYATSLQPPVSVIGKHRVFISGGWVQITDITGDWYTADGVVITLSLLDSVPIGASRTKPPLSLDQLKTQKKAAIRAAFEAASNANVTVAGVVYQGGYEKAMRLDAAKRLAELAGQTSTVFYDLANVGHTLTIAQATSVVLSISVTYQTEFARKQARMVAIDAAVLPADVDAVVY